MKIRIKASDIWSDRIKKVSEDAQRLKTETNCFSTRQQKSSHEGIAWCRSGVPDLFETASYFLCTELLLVYRFMWRATSLIHTSKKNLLNLLSIIFVLIFVNVKTLIMLMLFLEQARGRPTCRAGLNEREAPGKVVIARAPKRFAQLRSVSHAFVSNLQKHRSKTSKLIPFGSLHFRDNWGWACTAVRMWSICSNRKLYHKKTNLQTSSPSYGKRRFSACGHAGLPLQGFSTQICFFGLRTCIS